LIEHCVYLLITCSWEKFVKKTLHVRVKNS
jgi:hypothetical protein